MKKKDIQLIQEVKFFIDNKLGRELCIREICAEFGMNKNKLQKGFKLRFGHTIHAYIIRQKMLYAAEMLRNSDTPIKAIAINVGCTSSSFHINFKRAFGQSPEQFRKRERLITLFSYVLIALYLTMDLL